LTPPPLQDTLVITGRVNCVIKFYEYWCGGLCIKLVQSKQYIEEGENSVMYTECPLYGGADKSLARPTSRYILFDG